MLDYTNSLQFNIKIRTCPFSMFCYMSFIYSKSVSLLLKFLASLLAVLPDDRLHRLKHKYPSSKNINSLSIRIHWRRSHRRFLVVLSYIFASISFCCVTRYVFVVFVADFLLHLSSIDAELKAVERN